MKHLGLILAFLLLPILGVGAWLFMRKPSPVAPPLNNSLAASNAPAQQAHSTSAQPIQSANSGPVNDVLQGLAVGSQILNVASGIFSQFDQ